MLGRISSGAAVGAAAWVVPEILTAKPAAGATMSGTPGGGGGTTTSPSGTTGGTPAAAAQPTTNPSAAAPTSTPSSTSTGAPAALAMTGLNIKRDAEVGAALVAGGWAMQRWASRTPTVAGAEAGTTHEAGSQGDPA
jgi:hypothetical protein